MVNKHTKKRCLASLVIKKMEIKTMINLKRMTIPTVFDCVKQPELSDMAAVKYIVNFG